MNTTSRFINRELSWLEFNQRVLDEARNEEVPTLERLKFLAISSGNLDEFFMVRVGGLRLLLRDGVTKKDPTGMSPKQQLDAIEDRVREMNRDQYICLSEEIEPKLESLGIQRVQPDSLSDLQFDCLQQIFESEIFSILSPIAIQVAGKPECFPLLSSRQLCICIHIKVDKESMLGTSNEESQTRFAIIQISDVVPRFYTVPSAGGYEYVLIEDIIRLFVNRFFEGQEILDVVPFRITRNADLAIQEDQASDLMQELVEILEARKDSPCVRLEIIDKANDETLEMLKSSLDIEESQVFSMPGPLDLSFFMPLGSLGGYDDHRYPRWQAQTPPNYDPSETIFENVSQEGVLINHPYESFDPVVKLIQQAAEDPDVLSIKQTLYRTSRNSPIVGGLQRAAENGKSVTAIVELKARFDEKRNIDWARHLERAGVNVVYGVKGLKTHAKVSVVTRREPTGIKRYCHFGTGNYNEATAKIYSDISLLTCDPELGTDAMSFLNAITGYSQPRRLQKLVAAPVGLRRRILEMIEVEIQHAVKKEPAKIVAKLNALVDPQIIEALYEASQKGVEIKLNIRGICCLRPGVAGLSENIEVISIVDRYLEHARILHFLHGGDQRTFISSADWMGRNLDRRLELLVPVEHPEHQQKILTILDAYFNDNVKARRLTNEGEYQFVSQTTQSKKKFRAQFELYEIARETAALAKRTLMTKFEPHRAPTNT